MPSVRSWRKSSRQSDARVHDLISPPFWLWVVGTTSSACSTSVSFPICRSGSSASCSPVLRDFPDEKTKRIKIRSCDIRSSKANDKSRKFNLRFWWGQLAAGRSLKFASCRGGWGDRFCSRSASAINSVAVDRTPNLSSERRTLQYSTRHL